VTAVRRITLETWAERRYAKPPSRKTLYRWIRDARILPRPTKEGRAYFVMEDARVVDPSDPYSYEPSPQ
jgi:predicted site-specific integrase-resolvase